MLNKLEGEPLCISKSQLEKMVVVPTNEVEMVTVVRQLMTMVRSSRVDDAMNCFLKSRIQFAENSNAQWFHESMYTCLLSLMSTGTEATFKEQYQQAKWCINKAFSDEYDDLGVDKAVEDEMVALRDHFPYLRPPPPL